MESNRFPFFFNIKFLTIFVTKVYRICYNVHTEYIRRWKKMSVPFITKLFNNRLINVKDYIINNYKKLNLNEIEAMLLIHIFDLSESGEHFLSINQLKEKVTLTFVECSNCVFKLVQKNLIAFNMIIDDNGKRKEMFTLEPLFEKIVQDLFYEKDISVQTNIENEISKIKKGEMK